MGGEKKPLVMSELGCADGCGRRGCKGVAGNGWGEEAAGDERAWGRRGAENCAGRLRTAWVQGSGWKWVPLVMSELGCADGCGRRGCKGVAGNGWGEEAAGDERAWLRGRLRTACKGVAGNGGRRSRWG